MPRVITDGIGLEFGIEATMGANPATWKTIEIEDIASFGPIIETVSREPISRNRQRRKGVVVDLDSPVEFSADLTIGHVEDFIEGFLFSSSRFPFSGSGATRMIPPKANGTTFLANEGTPDQFEFPTITTALATGRLIFTRGFTNAGNNGLHVVTGGTATTAQVSASTLVDETPAQVSGASLEIAGHRYGIGTLNLTAFSASARTVTLTHTGGTVPFDTLGLSPGQVIHIGGLLAANQFNTGGKGFARIVSITATVLLLDKLSAGIVANDTGADDTVDLLYGSFTRNVATTDAEYLSRFYQFQLTQPGLITAAVNAYEYAESNQANEMVVQLPLTDKAGLSFSFVGTDTDPATETPRTTGATPVAPTKTAAFSDQSDLARLRLVKQDETVLADCLTDVSLSLNNQSSPEKCLGTLGAVFINQGTFLVDLSATAVFSSAEIINAIRNNTTLEFDVTLRNGDGAVNIDIPSLTLGDGSREYPRNESVKVSLSGEAFQDPVLGYSVGVSILPTVPLS
jgi:hypothetical protein